MIRFRLFRRPTPAELVARQLANAELHRLVALEDLERQQAYVDMLEKRVNRLRSELSVIVTEEPK